jgi:hypothetical protein
VRRALPALALLSLASIAIAQAPTVQTLPLAITVAEGTTTDDAWIAQQITNANTIFGPHGVAFREVHRGTMPASHARLENRRDRHALGTMMHPRAIDWFVVASLRDVDDPALYRQGVHWRPRGVGAPATAHFVITSQIAGENVLAHELGHYFGNGHSDVPGNIMSYSRGDRPPYFDDEQSRRIARNLRRFLAASELVLADRWTR